MANDTLAKRIATDPAYERTRENNAEFEAAARAAKIFSDSFRALTNTASDERLMGRLNQAMSKVVKTDLVSARGERNVATGDVLLLNGFEFNGRTKLRTIFFVQYTATIDRATGNLVVDIPEFVPKDRLKAPRGTTHFSLVYGAAEIDFVTGDYKEVTANTAEMVYGKAPQTAINLSQALTANSVRPLFLALGVRFYQEVNGAFYQLNAGKFNALCVVKVDKPAA